MKLSELVEQAGKLVSVENYCFPDLPNELACVKLYFKNTSCVVGVNEETDEVVISQSAILDNLIIIKTSSFFDIYVGRELLWVWELTNNQGYNDGIRLEFRNIETSIEFVVMASSIKTYKVDVV